MSTRTKLIISCLLALGCLAGPAAAAGPLAPFLLQDERQLSVKPDDRQMSVPEPQVGGQSRPPPGYWDDLL